MDPLVFYWNQGLKWYLPLWTGKYSKAYYSAILFLNWVQKEIKSTSLYQTMRLGIALIQFRSGLPKAKFHGYLLHLILPIWIPWRTFGEVIKKAVESLVQSYINRICESIADRIFKVIESRGVTLNYWYINNNQILFIDFDVINLIKIIVSRGITY